MEQAFCASGDAIAWLLGFFAFCFSQRAAATRTLAFFWIGVTEESSVNYTAGLENTIFTFQIYQKHSEQSRWENLTPYSHSSLGALLKISSLYALLTWLC